MLNIVGERERPNLDLPAMFGLHNVPFRERQIYLSSLHAYCTLAERYLPYAFSSSVVVHQAAGMQQYVHEQS